MNEEINTTAPQEQFEVQENIENTKDQTIINELDKTEQDSLPTEGAVEQAENKGEELLDKKEEKEEEDQVEVGDVTTSEGEKEEIKGGETERAEERAEERVEVKEEEAKVEENTEIEAKSDSEEELTDEEGSDEDAETEDESEAETRSYKSDIDYNTLSLKEIIQTFSDIIESGDQQEMYRNAERIKAAFYVTLKKEKIAIGYVAPSEEEITPESESDAEEVVSNNPFAEIERAFKGLYSQYKESRARYLHNMEKNKEDNLVKKLAVIEQLKELLEKQEDINQTFPAFREMQNRWREIGPVPQNRVKDLYETYQHCVEMFYDFVKINNELRDLDFKKNLEAKIVLCEKAEALENETNIISAFTQLQKLHEEWKELGPVRKEDREEIWNRFKEATALVNKKHQKHFESLKEDQKENLKNKTELCEKAEEVAKREIVDSNGWNVGSKEIEELQKTWKTIGFASKKDNQKIYDRFRAACDQFYSKKREYYSSFKDQMQDNYDKKVALCEQVEALKDSTDWKKTTDQLINIQKQWKEIGPVSRKRSDQVWKRFRAACDFFFENRDKHSGNSNVQFEENLQKKIALIEQIQTFVLTGESEKDIEALNDFQAKWREIGFVPAKNKDKIQSDFRTSLENKFADYKEHIQEQRAASGDRGNRRQGRDNRNRQNDRGPRSEIERLILKYRKKEADIATWENNMGFFAKSKNADALLEELNKQIVAAKEELSQLEQKIKSLENQND